MSFQHATAIDWLAKDMLVVKIYLSLVHMVVIFCLACGKRGSGEELRFCSVQCAPLLFQWATVVGWGGVFWCYFYLELIGSPSFGDGYFAVHDVLSIVFIYAFMCLEPSILYLKVLHIKLLSCDKCTESLLCHKALSFISQTSFYPVMSYLKIVSLNVKEFNNTIKRQKILTFLKKEKTQMKPT